MAPPQLSPRRHDRAARRHPEDRPDRRGHRDAGARHPRPRSRGDPAAPTSLLTGATAVGIDVSEKLSDALPIYLLLVVGLSFLLLMLVFRSMLVPLKAALGFLLTVGATFGITVAVFQQGHLADLVGLDTPGPAGQLPADPAHRHPVRPRHGLRGVPGLPDARGLRARRRPRSEATISGIGHGARVVTAAALIMIVGVRRLHPRSTTRSSSRSASRSPSASPSTRSWSG